MRILAVLAAELLFISIARRIVNTPEEQPIQEYPKSEAQKQLIVDIGGFMFHIQDNHNPAPLCPTCLKWRDLIQATATNRVAEA